jgi:hypothetical protein
MNPSQLPPRPDPQTGEPRPPEAPVDGHRRTAERDEKARHKVPSPPAGGGPVLEWFHSTRNSAWISALVFPVIGFALYTVWDGGFGWMKAWYLWAILLAPIPLMYWKTSGVAMSAGADWFSRSEGRHLWTYELVKVKVSVGGTGRWLDLEDARGGMLYMNEVDIQQNPKLWDLVYLGILYSVHEGGAETNNLAVTHLELNYPPFFRK